MAKLLSTEGDNWRVKINWTIENEEGENWELNFKGPRGDYETALRHNYLLLSHIYGKDDKDVPSIQAIIDEMNVL